MFKTLLFALTAASLTACAVPLSKHPLEPAGFGVPITDEAVVMSASTPGPISMEKISVATWRFGVRHCQPAPAKCKVEGRDLNAEVFVYLVNHPEHGTYLIDAGFPENHLDDFGGLLKSTLDGEEGLKVSATLGEVLKARGVSELQGVFVTHLHFDHIQGVRDLPLETPIYVGPGAGRDRHLYFRLISAPLRAALKDRPPLRVLPFTQPNDLVDVFGDGSLIAIHVPGHTLGSTAYFLNTADGAHLITGDAVMDVASWTGPDREVQGFKSNFETMWTSRDRLRALAARVSGIRVHPGHERFEAMRK